MEIVKKINQILQEYSSGNKVNAYKKLKKIFFQHQSNNKIRFNIAVMEQELGFTTEARNNYTFLIDKENHLKSMINLYLLELKEEKNIDALNIINKILDKDNSLINVLVDKAFVYYKLNKIKESLDICTSLLKQKKSDVRVLNILGLCFFAKKNYKEAESIFLNGLDIDPNFIPLLNSLGRLYHESRETNKAEKNFLKALSIQPTAYQTINNIAGYYLEEGGYEKAIKYYKKAIELNPKNAIIINNIAKAYLSLNNTNLAEYFCSKALKINKNNDEIKKTFALIFLRKLDFKKAWKYFDGRLSLSDFSNKNKSLIYVKNKLFNLSTLDNNSKILVLREQGVGDEILYGSMYGDLLEKNQNVTIECDERLIPLFKYSFNKNHKHKFINLGSISKHEDKLKNYDFVLYAGSLGKFFRNNINLFPKTSYLDVEQELINQNKNKVAKLKNRFNIGISWKSFKNRYAREKSLELEELINIFKTPNCNFINIQYGDVNEEINIFCSKYKINITTIKNLDLFKNLAGVAGLLKNLDLFISVSNSTAHLAGALGVKTLLIKPFNHATYHYWNQPSSKTPWYSSIILINKETINEENNIIKKNLDKLE